ncbi:phage tail protein, partial [Streptomyces afghaniensis]|uniref:phage tail protein n=1 Tax=Streptomyces afghaniensis TaxID=66865 RepID=UPI002468DBF6
MAKFTVNSTRFDPYLGYRFKIKWDNQYVAALSKCSALKRTTEVTPWYEGVTRAGRIRLPGKTKYERHHFGAGVTHDTASRVATSTTTFRRRR